MLLCIALHLPSQVHHINQKDWGSIGNHKLSVFDLLLRSPFFLNLENIMEDSLENKYMDLLFDLLC